ncbi:cytidine deaminase [Proteiniborus sp. MB09-C3]|uniref:cytidine deaminase n=1 Tax=Proteiniborus sp. MB09-C3 TaxID=3050072 RepID=UPI002553C4A7|nr:cytidine deaminase [Proteiniborus sp. MB09-C3]WIV10699.1 cytidine deaminase [Proteiniborus sp. MB09-C3]
MNVKELISKALEAREKAYVPYSDFKVGAALLSKSGNIYTGCNIESASYTPTICAERTAISKAVSEGDREIEAIAVVGNPQDYTYPCGVCRQVIREFGKDATLIIAKNEEEYKVYKLEELLPFSFGPEDLDK